MPFHWDEFDYKFRSYAIDNSILDNMKGDLKAIESHINGELECLKAMLRQSEKKIIAI